MGFLRRIFGAVDRTYLVRAYVIGIAIFAFYGWMFAQSHVPFRSSMWFFFGLSTLLFPFAKLVWDEIMGMLMGRNIVIMPALILFFVKLMVNVLLWAAAILIAPLGVLYLWFKTRPPAR